MKDGAHADIRSLGRRSARAEACGLYQMLGRVGNTVEAIRNLIAVPRLAETGGQMSLRPLLFWRGPIVTRQLLPPHQPQPPADRAVLPTGKGEEVRRGDIVDDGVRILVARKIDHCESRRPLMPMKTEALLDAKV